MKLFIQVIDETGRSNLSFNLACRLKDMNIHWHDDASCQLRIDTGNQTKLRVELTREDLDDFQNELNSHDR